MNITTTLSSRPRRSLGRPGVTSSLFILLATFALFILAHGDDRHAANRVAVSSDQDRVVPPFVERGMTAMEATRLLGEPDERLSAEVWVYWRYRVSGEDSNAASFDTLIVTLAAGKVAALKVVDAREVRAWIAVHGTMRSRRIVAADSR